MKKRKRILTLLLAVLCCVLLMSGCEEEPKQELNLSDAQKIVELSTVKAYYHDVVKIEESGSKAFFGLGDIGYKKMWVEYTGIVTMGVDASKIKISKPSGSGVVTVTMPTEVIIGDPDIDEDSISEPLVEKGWFTKITTKERKQALIESQEKMMEKAGADQAMQKQALKRAKDMIEQYIISVGDAIGADYTVEWEDAETEL